jgi:hypothetical protein
MSEGPSREPEAGPSGHLPSPRRRDRGIGPEAACRRHRHLRRRRLRADQASPARERADHDPRRGQDHHGLRGAAADPGTIEVEFDRHGSVDTTGLPVCFEGQLEATTVSQARKACGGAIVGKGRGAAVVKFPEQGPIRASSPITIFNGPKKNGNPTVLAHAYLTDPIVTTFIVPVVIEKIHKGIYGYRTKATIPKIANGAGIPISGSLKIGKKWTYKGEPHSYVSARCETGRLQARGQIRFKDGTYLSGTFLRPCQVRR